jgi:protein involved in polysaccharide export with SLBB domain
MHPGRSVLLLGLLVVAGCAVDRSQIDRALMARRTAVSQPQAASHYQLESPDVLAIRVRGRNDLSGIKVVGPDGRIEVGKLGRLRVEGHTVPEVVQLVSMVSDIEPKQVAVQMVAFNSQQVYLFGAGIGSQRCVPYRGDETVIDLLQRVGGITAGAAPNHIYVVRPHVVEGKPPEVFHINLPAILERGDEKTNIRVQPFDEIHVGETRQSRFEKCVPPLLRPLYEAVWGLYRQSPEGEKPVAPYSVQR